MSDSAEEIIKQAYERRFKEIEDKIKQILIEIKDIPLLLHKIETLIEAQKLMNKELEIIGELHTQVALLEQSMKNMESLDKDYSSLWEKTIPEMKDNISKLKDLIYTVERSLESKLMKLNDNKIEPLQKESARMSLIYSIICSVVTGGLIYFFTRH